MALDTYRTPIFDAPVLSWYSVFFANKLPWLLGRHMSIALHDIVLYYLCHGLFLYQQYLSLLDSLVALTSLPTVEGGKDLPKCDKINS